MPPFATFRKLKFRVASLVLPVGAALMVSLTVWAGPQDGTVILGDVDITQPSPTDLDIIQGTDKAIIDWLSFSIGTDEKVRFLQPSSSSMTLNRVRGSSYSRILGQLIANGHILLINPNGILFGETANVDVGGLIATTIDMTDEDFEAGRLNFGVSGNPDGSVVNRGGITVAEGGLVALVAPGVENSGVIRARLGRVSLASGNSFTLDLHGDNLIKIEVDDRIAERLTAPDGAELKALVGNSGLISADGGSVVLLAAGAARDVVDHAINMEGIIEARSAVERNGQIVLQGAGEGIVRVTGTLDASGRGDGETGGSIKVLGEKVGIVGHANIDATGDAGGGEILMGGNFQGRGPERNAEYTAIGGDAEIRADAVSGGDGGRVIVWSDRVTRFFGTISARGGLSFGDGGFAEVSGKQHLQFAPGSIDLGAANGVSGTLLLDPRDIIISDSDGSDNSKISASDTSINFSDDTGTDYNIQPSAFETINADITLQATRDITVSSAIDRSGAANSTMTLQAGRHININAAITGTNGAHSFIFEADSPRSGTANDGTGKLTIGSSGAITTNNGSVTLIAAAFDIGAAIDAGTGDIHIAPSQSVAMTISNTADNLSNTEIGQFTTSGTINIGTATTGPTGTGGAGSSISASSITISEALTVGGSASIAFDSSGTTSLGVNVSAADGNVTFSDAVTLTAAVTVDSDSDNDADDGDITFASTVNGGYALTLDADGGAVNLQGAVGGTTALTSLTVDGGQIDLNAVATTGAIDIDGTNIDLNGATYESDDGNVDFRAAVDLTVNVTVDSDKDNASTDGNITFHSTVNGGYTLTLDADGGAVELKGAVGGTTALTSLTVDGGQIDLNAVATTGAIDIDGTNIDLNGATYESDDGDIDFRAAVDLTVNVTVDSDKDDDSTDGDITFHSTVNGAKTLTLDAGGGAVDLQGVVGGTTKLTSLTIDGGQIDLNTVKTTGNIDVEGTNIDLNAATYESDDGNIKFTGAVDLAVNTTVDSDKDNDANDGDITFTSTVNGAKTLTLDADSGDVDLQGAVGGTTELTDLTITGADITLGAVTLTGTLTLTPSGTITLKGNITVDDSNVSFSRAVVLGADVTIDTDGNDDGTDGTITFSSTVNGGYALTLDADGGAVTLSGVVGGTTKLASLTIDGGQIDIDTVATTGAIDIDGSNIDLNGATYESDNGSIDFRAAVDLTVNVSVDSDKNDDTTDGTITFHSTVDGAKTLTLDADSGAVELKGAVGGTTKLTSLTVDGGQIDIDTVKTTGNIDIEGTNIDLNAATYESDDGNIKFTGPVDLTVNVSMDSDKDNDATDGDITFTSTVNGAKTLTLDAGGGAVDLQGVVGGTTKLTSLTVDGGQIDLNTVKTTGNIDVEGTNIDLNGATYESDDGNIKFTGPVDLTVNVSMDSDKDDDSTDGDITFTSTVNGAKTLTLDAGGGAVDLQGVVGGTTKLTSLTVDGGQIDLSTVKTTGNIDVEGTNIDLNAATYESDDGNIKFTGPVDLTVNTTVDSDKDNDATDGDITFTSTVNGGFALTLDASGGDVDLQGAVGGTTELTNLSITGADIALDAVTLTGTLTLTPSGTITLKGNITVDDSNVSFSRAVVLGGDVTIDTDGDDDGTDGTITFSSTVNGGHALALDADGAAVTLSGAVGGTTKLASLTIDGGQIDIDTVKTTGDIDIEGTNIDLNAATYESNDGNIKFTGAVDLTADTTVDSDKDNDSTDGDITFTSTVNGAKSLTLDADGGDVDLQGAVGGTTELTNLTITGADIDLSAVTLTGTLTLTPSGTITLEGDITVDDSAVSFSNAVGPGRRRHDRHRRRQ